MSDNLDRRDGAPPSAMPAAPARADGATGDDAGAGDRPVPVAAQAGADRPGSDPAAGEASPGAPVVTEELVKLALRRVKDPELNLNIIDLGLIYAIHVDGTTVSVDMSLTSPGCPSGPEIMRDVEQQLRAMPGVEDVVVNLVWSPYWTPERIEPRVRAYLGF
jgi:metal-sulfur cluster biosynthetic enzyme